MIVHSMWRGRGTTGRVNIWEFGSGLGFPFPLEPAAVIVVEASGDRRSCGGELSLIERVTG